MSRVIECDDTEFFTRTLDNSRTFVVDFNATWCRPCREMAPIFNSLSKQFPYLTFLSVDIDKAQNTATKFGIRSVPTFMFMEGTNVVDQVGGMDQDQLEEKCKKYGTPKKGEPKMIDVYCTLEELYTGCEKEIEFTRKRRQMDGELFDQERKISFAIKAGWKAGTKLTYPGEGDESGMRLASDVIFVIRESSHDHFRREGNDLIYDINLDLPYFLSTNQIKAEVPLIEGGIYSFIKQNPNHLITSEVVLGRGMPISKQPGTRGDLIIKSNILLPPKPISNDKIAQIKALLG